LSVIHPAEPFATTAPTPDFAQLSAVRWSAEIDRQPPRPFLADPARGQLLDHATNSWQVCDLK